MLGKPLRLGLAPRNFLGARPLLVAVLGTSLGITALSATRTADAAIERALTSTRRAIANLLATRTRTLAEMSAVSAGVPQFREGLSASRERADILHQAQEYRDLIGAAWVLVTNEAGVLLARTDYPAEVDRDPSSRPLVAGGGGAPAGPRGPHSLGGGRRVGGFRGVPLARRGARRIPGAAGPRGRGAAARRGLSAGAGVRADPPRQRLAAFFLQQPHRRRVVASDHLAPRHRIQHAVHVRGSHRSRVHGRHVGLVGHGAVLAARGGEEGERYKPANHGYP